jgi:hypothetical protein
MSNQERQSNFENAVLIPLVQSAVTGFLAGGAVGATAWILDAEHPLSLAGASWIVATYIAWLAYRAGWQYRLERVLGIDLTGDDVIGEPVEESASLPAPTPKVRVEISKDDGRGVEWLDLPVDYERLVMFSREMTKGATFSYASLAGRDKLFSRPEFEILRDAFLKRGFARWINPHSRNQGVELTGKGRALIRQFALTIEATSPPPLQKDGR